MDFPNVRSRYQSNASILLLLACYFAVTIAYGWLNPLFEAPDELWHYRYIQHLQQTRALPIQDPNRKDIGPRQEGSQPPLYYVFAALLAAPFGGDDLEGYEAFNPAYRPAVDTDIAERNLVYHAERQGIRYSETARAVHLIRLFSSLLGAVTVLLTYCIARQVLPAKKMVAIIAAALVAFLPQFDFVSAAINNDNLAIAAATLSFWLLMRLWQRHSTARLILLGLAVGAAALAKLSAVGLAPVIVLGIAVSPSTRGNWRLRLRDLTIVGGTALLVAGWWYIRNLLIYGDPLGLNVMVAMAGPRETVPNWQDWLDFAREVKSSFWALFGWTNVPADNWFYFLADCIMLVALVGIVYRLVTAARGNSRPTALLILVMWILAVLLALVNWNRITVAPQGRLLFAAICPIAILAAWGLTTFRVRGIPIVAAVVAVTMAGMSVYALSAYLVPSYPILPVLDARSVNGSYTPHDVAFGDHYRLLGYRLSKETVHPGDSVTVYLFWQYDEQLVPSRLRFVHLVADGEQLFGGGDKVIGGDIPEGIWRSGDVLRDEHEIVVPFGTVAPILADVTVGLYEPGTMRRSAAKDGSGSPAGDAPTIVRLKILPSAISVPPSADRLGMSFGGKISLVASELPSREVRAGQPVPGKLYWRALTSPNLDYTVFVHLVRDGKPFAQYDSQPRKGRFPTSAWELGDIVPDDFALPTSESLAPGKYRLQVGLYSLADGKRLVTDGGTIADLGVITVHN